MLQYHHSIDYLLNYYMLQNSFTALKGFQGHVNPLSDYLLSEEYTFQYLLCIYTDQLHAAISENPLSTDIAACKVILIRVIMILMRVIMILPHVN